MDDIGTATLSSDGTSQTVHLPEGFALPGRRVQVRRVGDSLVLEPVAFDLDEWWASLKEYEDIPFMEDGRQQPLMPLSDDISFD